jgi:O-antigen/teichoic acid export membrane protein
VIPFVTIQNVALPLVRPLLIGILVLAGLATDRLVAATWGLPWVGAAIVAGIIIVRQLKKATTRDASLTPARPLGSVSREFWSFASARAFAGAAETTLVWLDVLLVGLLVGPYEAGIYAAASRFVTGGTLTMQASRIAISPRLSRLLSAGRTRDAERLYNGGTLAVVASSWPLYIGLACFSSTLLRLFGHSFPRGATALTVLSVAMLIDTGTGNIASVLLMGGKSKWNLVNAGTGLTVDVVVDLLLIPHYGATGAAIGWAASIATINTLATAEVHFLMRLKVVDRAIVKAAFAALVCFGIPGLLLRFLAHGAWPLAAWAAIGSVTYGAWWWSRRRDPGVASVVQAFRGITARRTTGTRR